MKKKATVLCLVGALALGTCTVSAANGTKNISATFRNIKIVVDGKTLSTSAEPFIYNGTTYLPIRAVGEAVGKEVTWNGNTNTVYLGEVPAGAQQAQQAPAPAATGDLPMVSAFLTAEAGLDSNEIAELFAEMRTAPALIADVYIEACYYSASEGDAQRMQALYAEAQTALARCTGNAAEVAEVKAYLTEFYEGNILPML